MQLSEMVSLHLLWCWTHLTIACGHEHVCIVKCWLKSQPCDTPWLHIHPRSASQIEPVQLSHWSNFNFAYLWHWSLKAYTADVWLNTLYQLKSMATTPCTKQEVLLILCVYQFALHLNTDSCKARVEIFTKEFWTQAKLKWAITKYSKLAGSIAIVAIVAIVQFKCMMNWYTRSVDSTSCLVQGVLATPFNC